MIYLVNDKPDPPVNNWRQYVYFFSNKEPKIGDKVLILGYYGNGFMKIEDNWQWEKLPIVFIKPPKREWIKTAFGDAI